MNLCNDGKGSLSKVTSTGTMKSGDAVSDQFPAGLRVLVVDDDPTCLMILEKMLRTCLYEVTKCKRAEIALSLLRKNKNGFDIVISNVHMRDMNGFKLLEHIGLEMNLLVIMMSADDGKNVVMKGVTHCACDYVIKPVPIEALKNIWQHVVRNKMQPRAVWSFELHQQFVTAVDQLGIDKAVPKKVLELMNVPGLTRDNVASHLQKYRLFLQKLSEVSQHQNNMNNLFLNSHEASFAAKFVAICGLVGEFLTSIICLCSTDTSTKSSNSSSSKTL